MVEYVGESPTNVGILHRLRVGAGSSLEALRELVGQILAGSGGTPLPDATWAEGGRFASFDDLARYHAEVLMVGDRPGQ